MAVDVDQFSKEPIYRARVPCAQVLEDLQRLAELDAVKEQKQTRAHRVGLGTLIAAAPALFLALIGPAGVFSMVMGWGGAALILVGIAAFVIRSHHKQLNLENRRYELASRTVGLLQADISPDEPVTLELDLRPEAHSDKFQNEGKTRTGWKVKYYLDPWLSVQGRLLDGTHFRLEMTERVELRSRVKTNARGKTKFKSKRLSDALVRVRLRVKPERYQHLGRLGSRAMEAVQVLKGTRLKALTVDTDRLDMTVLVDPPWSTPNAPPAQGGTTPPLDGPRVVAMAFLSLYQLLNLSRAIDKKAVHSRTG